MAERGELDMCSGPVAGKLIRFSIPVMLTGILQLLFNAADTVVVGNFCGSVSMAAVGSNGSLINLIVNLFVGISTGTNVLVARSWGRRHFDEVSRTVHTSVLLSVFLGIFTGIFGATFAPQLLKLMSVPDNVRTLAALYLRIYFIGVPATVVYNFAAAVLRAIGDTKHPMYYLTASGIVNVICNLLLVCVIRLDVAGVAIASALSQYVAAVLVLRCLAKKENACRLTRSGLHISRAELVNIVRIGLPAGLQGTVFSISNVLIQSSINSFGADVIAGNVAASNLDGFIYISLNSFYQAAIAFVSQNIGAGKPERIRRIAGSLVLLTTAIGALLGVLLYLFGTPLLHIYNREPAVVEAGLIRIRLVGMLYFGCGLMEVGCGLVRGMGRTWLPMIVSVLGACVLRIIWILTVFSAHHTLEVLYISYPVSWAVTTLVHFICAYVTRRKIMAQSAHAKQAG